MSNEKLDQAKHALYQLEKLRAPTQAEKFTDMQTAFLSAATAAMEKLPGYKAKVAALPPADRDFFLAMRQMRNADAHDGGAPIAVDYVDVPLGAASREELGGRYEVSGSFLGGPAPTFSRRLHHFKFPDGSKVEVVGACRRYLEIVTHIVTAPIAAATGASPAANSGSP